jgi:hypothetical protein
MDNLRDTAAACGRGHNVKYEKTAPRTIRTANKRGWHVIEVPRNYVDKNVSWLGLCIWTDRHATGRHLNNFAMRKFAFQNDADASMFLFQWCL